MAYLDVAAHDVLGYVHPSIIPAPPSLGGIERKAVMLVGVDLPTSLPDPGFRRKLMEMLVGADRTNPLATRRLEALRRFAVAVAYRRDDMADRTEAELSALGFDSARIGEARTLALSCRPALS